MICGKPVRISAGYKWGKANALGIMDDDETYLVTTGFDDEFNGNIARFAVKAINCHEALITALHSIEDFLHRDDDGNEELYGDIFEIIDKALEMVDAAEKEVKP